MKPVILRFPGGTFTVRLVPTLMTVFMVAVMLCLGAWQVERLHWKENLIAAMHERMQQAPIAIQSLNTDDPIDYRPASANGAFLDTVFYLAATSLDGQGGYHVLQPFLMDGGEAVIIDRGWIPYNLKDQRDQFAPPQGRVTITGILRIPQHNWAQPANRPATNDWYWVDPTAMALQAQVPALDPFILVVDKGLTSGEYPIGGQTWLELPNNHFQYALTWYGLAATLTIIYLIQGFRRNQKP